MVKSNWFTRGWTLQELLAPKELEFFDKTWQLMDTRAKHSKTIEDATSIAPEYLNGDLRFRKACIATKMSWASCRTTSLPADAAYCMVGLFDIKNMTVHYGHGQAAFLRLQEELVNQTNDESIFAWTNHSLPESGLLAPSPSCSAGSAGFTTRNKDCKRRAGYSTSMGGIKFWLPSALPDHANGADWNSLIAQRRTSYDLRLKYWTAGTGKNAKTVMISLQKDRWPMASNEVQPAHVCEQATEEQRKRFRSWHQSETCAHPAHCLAVLVRSRIEDAYICFPEAAGC
jgi:hypothetical protein